MTSDLISQICREDGGGKSPAAIRRDGAFKGQRPQNRLFQLNPYVEGIDTGQVVSRSNLGFLDIGSFFFF